jgi:hypothetical protein
MKAAGSKGLMLAVAASLGVMMSAGQALATLRHAAKKTASVVAGSVSGGPNVKVTVVRTGKSSKTNASGFFVLNGTNLAGKHQVVFTKGNKTYSTTILVPAGSKVSLQNVKLNSNGTAQAEQEDVEVQGTLSAVDCVASPNTVTIAPSGGGASVVMSFDATTTEIVDDATQTKVPDCNTLASNYLNAPVKAEGTQAADGSIVADAIELNPGQEGGGGGQDVHFRGTVQSENCPTSIVAQRRDSTNVTVNLSPSTEINIGGSDSHSSGACTDIPQGANVSVEGTPQPDGSVNASQIEVRNDQMESEGNINSLNCGATPPSFSFTPDGAAAAITVTIGATTQIQVGNNESAVCTDLATVPAKVEGVTQPDGSLAASRIEQEGSGGDGGGSDGGND